MVFLKLTNYTVYFRNLFWSIVLWGFLFVVEPCLLLILTIWFTYAYQEDFMCMFGFGYYKKKDAQDSLSDIYFDSANSPWQDNIYARGNCKKSLAHILCMSSNASLHLLQITDCQGHRLSLSQYSFYYCLTYR